MSILINQNAMNFYLINKWSINKLQSSVTYFMKYVGESFGEDQRNDLYKRIGSITKSN